MYLRHLFILVFIALVALGARCETEPEAKKFVLVIDAGHGGKDVGAQSREGHLAESCYNLPWSALLAAVSLEYLLMLPRRSLA